jgi:5'-3' exonuclease
LAGSPDHPSLIVTIPDPPETRPMLVDGMGMLVRSVRAASRGARLSHDGVSTGPLTLFMGSMTAQLRQHEPTHVVVCWEGDPEANWRRRLYAQYKPRSQRVARMSQDEELARAFCAAAGLRQDWKAEFEGDDMMAAWWRISRRSAPGSEVAIVSDDRDLLQLCDARTGVWPLSVGEREGPVTESVVESLWGCPPGRLPLLRALAGDPADGIPGVPGIGPRRAAQLLREFPEDDALLDSLGKVRGEDDGAAGLAQLYRILMELRDPMNRPYDDKGVAGWAGPTSRELGMQSLLDSARWRPEYYSGLLLEFLRKHGMERMTKWIMDGKLPWPPVG